MFLSLFLASMPRTNWMAIRQRAVPTAIRHFRGGLASASTVVPQRMDVTSVCETKRKPKVVVIGSGLAGLTAAITAAESSADVLLLEKNDKLGGNSAKATSGINSVNAKEGDTPERFIEDTKKAGHQVNDPGLLELLAEKSTDALHFLHDRLVSDASESGGTVNELSNAIRGGGHSIARTFRFPPDSETGRPVPVGWTLVSTLERHLRKLPNAQIMSGMEVTGLVTNKDQQKVTGVKAHRTSDDTKASDSASVKVESIDADAVILASGGFAASEGLLHRYAPKFAQLPTTNGAWATGDGLEIATGVGVATRDLVHVQVHPTGFLHPSRPRERSVFLAPEALRACGGVLISPTSGKRFANELLPRDKLASAIFTHAQPLRAWLSARDRDSENDKENKESSDSSSKEESQEMAVAGMLLSEKTVEAFGHNAVKFYEKMGVLTRYGDLGEVATEMRVPLQTLRDDLDAYAEFSDEEGGKKDPHGKQYFPNSSSYKSQTEPKPFWLGWITPSLHYCMGGLMFTQKGELVKADGTAIKGLYGAGEVVGGVHGANRLVGNSLLECVVYGRISGSNAASYAAESVAKKLNTGA